MAILAGDIRLHESKTMLDTPEGGGGPTSNVVPDGTSNAIFTDISELDRVNGRVNARQLHVVVNSDDTDIFLGSNVIVAEPPSDPNVSITIFGTGKPFDTRADAIARVEAYQSVGPVYPGVLFGNHIEGQQTLLIYQKSEASPAIGDTLALIKREGYVDEFVQYVRVTTVELVETEFEDAAGKFKRYVMTLGLSDALRADFPGFDISRYDYTSAQVALKTKVTETIVADAARYYGVSVLTEDADLGEFTILADSMFTQLVPSAQVETPIADARANQVNASVVAGGEPFTYNVTAVFTPTQALYIGGAITPGSLMITRAGFTMNDEGGKLLLAGEQVGNVDYANGLLTLTAEISSGNISNTITYVPAATPTTVSQIQGFEVTAANRALNYVRTISPAPVRGSLFVDYRSNGKWYRLQDDGSGALRGAASGIGAGNINYSSGTVTVTLGALPDVDSSVLYGWVDPFTTQPADELTLDNGGNLYFPMNTDGEMSLEPGSKAIEPGALEITWSHSGTKTVTDDGEGNLVGDGTGTVDYSQGTIRLSPTVLPPHGTQINLSLAAAKAKTTASSALSSAGPVKTFTFGVSNIKPGTVWITVSGQLKFNYDSGPTTNWGDARSLVLADLLGDGDLYLLDRAGSLLVGEIDYASGTGTINQALTVPDSNAREMVHFDNIYQRITVMNLGMRAA